MDNNGSSERLDRLEHMMSVLLVQIIEQRAEVAALMVSLEAQLPGKKEILQWDFAEEKARSVKRLREELGALDPIALGSLLRYLQRLKKT
jgi:hypothetical protein